MIRSIFLAAAMLVALVSASSAGEVPRPDIQYTDSHEAMPLLPRRFQNHCTWRWGHFYCENRCGRDYQVYFCSPRSFGCCHVGHGYCGEGGLLRCRP